MKKIFLSMLLSVVASTLFMNTVFAEIMLFVGDGCPHCATVEKYIVENNVAEKLPITVYEVWHNTQNQAIYMQKADEVGYQGGGVPLLVDGGYYTVGSDTIIDYFQSLIDKQNAEAQKKLQEEAKPVTPLNETIKAQTPPALEAKDAEITDDKTAEDTAQADEETAREESTAFYIIIGFIGAVFVFVLYYSIIKK